MIKGTTESGFKYQIDEEVLKDWRFIKKLSRLKELEEEDDSMEIDFINIMADIESLLFKDKGKSFEKHIASINNGHVPTDILLKELLEIVKNNNETKNS